LQKDGIELSDGTLACEDDNDNSDVIECAQEIVGMDFFDVTIATDDHNEDSVSVEPRQEIVGRGSTSASYVTRLLLKIMVDAGKAHDQGDPSENEGQRAVHNSSRVYIGGNKKSHILNCSVPEIDGDEVHVDVNDDGDAQEAIVDKSSV